MTFFFKHKTLTMDESIIKCVLSEHLPKLYPDDFSFKHPTSKIGIKIELCRFSSKCAS